MGGAVEPIVVYNAGEKFGGLRFVRIGDHWGRCRPGGDLAPSCCCCYGCYGVLLSCEVWPRAVRARMKHIS